MICGVGGFPLPVSYPELGSKRRAEQREYEERLDEAMERCRNEELVTNQ